MVFHKLEVKSVSYCCITKYHLVGSPPTGLVTLLIQENIFLLFNPKLDCSGGLPGDEVVAGDDLVWTIVVLSHAVLCHHVPECH